MNNLVDKQQLLVKRQLRDQQNALTAKQQLLVKAELAQKRESKTENT
jgi:hypothetical protein